MKNIFLAPRSNETAYKNFESTIVAGRPYSFLAPYLTPAEKTTLISRKNIKIWGAQESLKSRWDKMKPGDYVLFYKDGAFYYSAQVLLTKYSLSLGKQLWPKNKSGTYWSCLFFVDNVKEIHIPIQTLQELAGYKPEWDRVQGFMPLNEYGLNSIVEKFGSIEMFLKQPPVVYTAIETLIEESKDEQIQSEYKVRNRAQILRDAINFEYERASHKISHSPHRVRLDNKTQKKRIADLELNSCQICGWKLEWKNKNGKIGYRIDVDHIKEKADGGTESIKNLWVLCPNCHAKKTCGVIKVDLKKKQVWENDSKIKLKHDRHLFVDLPSKEDKTTK